MDSFVEFLLYLQGPIPYLVAFLVLLGCGFGVPIPEDIVLFAMGLLSYYGLVDLKISILVCFAGVLIGDMTVFYLGRHFGVRLLKTQLFAKSLHPERMGRTRELLLRWGNKVIFAARFMPGLRAPMFFSAGTFQLPFRVFIFYDGLAALLSVPLLVGVVFYFGDQVHRVIMVAKKVQYGIFGLILAIVLFVAAKHFIVKARVARKSH